MKKLYDGQKHSLYQLQKDLNLNIMRLYRYADGVVSVDKMPISLLNDIARLEGIEPNELFKKMKEYEQVKRKEKNKYD